MTSEQFISAVPFEIMHVPFQPHFINWYIALCGIMLNAVNNRVGRAVLCTYCCRNLEILTHSLPAI